MAHQQQLQSLETWASARVSNLLGGSLSADEARQLIANVVTLTSREEVSAFLQDLIGTSPEALEFISTFVERRFTHAPVTGAWTVSANAARRQQQREQEEILQQQQKQLLEEQRKAESGKLSNRQAKKLAMQREKMEIVGKAPPGLNGRPVCECMDTNQGELTQSYVDVTITVDCYSRWAGNRRRRIDQTSYKHPKATVHGLLTNCLVCGKIICMFEGSGPCPTCGTVVTSKENQRNFALTRTMLDAERKQHKPSHTTDNADSNSYSVAEARKERLLEFDQNSAARTHVHDMASDFDVGSEFNKWLTPEERALAVKRTQERDRLEEEKQRRRVITIDIENRRVVVDRNPDASFRDVGSKSTNPALEDAAFGRVPDTHDTITDGADGDDKSTLVAGGAFRNPTLKTAPPVFIPREKQTQLATSSSKSDRRASTKQPVNQPRPKRLPRLQDDFRENLAVGYDTALGADYDADYDGPTC